MGVWVDPQSEGVKAAPSRRFEATIVDYAYKKLILSMEVSGKAAQSHLCGT